MRSYDQCGSAHCSAIGFTTQRYSVKDGQKEEVVAIQNEEDGSEACQMPRPYNFDFAGKRGHIFMEDNC